MNSALYLVVIAGGSGTRFWPKSTSKKPKQFLSFGSQTKTLLAETVSRFESIVPREQRMIVTTQSLKGLVKAEDLNLNIMAEPQGRNTAPCIYWAARTVAKTNPKGIMLVMPSDHYIAHTGKFIATLLDAVHWASHNDDLVTLGIQPTRPETGYGYLKTTTSEDVRNSLRGAKKVEAFVEKPSYEKAKEFLHSGNYLWNGGMFVWRAEVILSAFDKYMPEMKKAWDSAHGNIESAYPKMTATSIDYGIMEKANNVVTFPLDCGWDDLGSWTSLETLADALEARKENNVLTDGELLSIDSVGNIIDAPDHLVALIGINNSIIVKQGEVILVAQKDRAQDIRQIVERVKTVKPELA